MAQHKHDDFCVKTLREEIDLLREENRQLRQLMLPDVPPQFDLTMGEWRLVYIVLKNSPISKARLYELFYWGHENPPDSKGLDVLIHRARQKLSAFGIYIRTINRWGYEAEWEQRWTNNPLSQLQLLQGAATSPCTRLDDQHL